MEMASSADKEIADTDDDLTKTIAEIADFLENRRSGLEKEFEDVVLGNAGFGVEYFYKSKFGDPSSVSSLILPWLPLFRKLKAKSIQELNDAIAELSKSNDKLKESFDELAEIENDWNELLKNKIDPALNEHFGSSVPVNVNPAGISLTDVDTNRRVFLNQYLHTPHSLLVLLRFYGSAQCVDHVRDLQRLIETFTKVKNCGIVLICRGTSEGGRLWRQKTGLTVFPLLADEDGEFVDAFKFGRSVWSSCRTCYAKETAGQIIQNSQNLTKSPLQIVIPDKLHDLHQTGGDVIITETGKIIFLSKRQQETFFDSRQAPEDVLGKIPDSNKIGPKKASRNIFKKIF